VRNYALYLEERLESFRVLTYDVEKDPSVGNLVQFIVFAPHTKFSLVYC
jgi:hypothetical protein